MGRRKQVPEFTPDLVDEAVLLLVSATAATTVQAALVAKLGATELADALIAEARRKITVAADYDRDHEVGMSKHRLEDILRRSLEAGNSRIALDAQRELNKLLDLYPPAPRLPDPSDHDAEADEEDAEAARRYLRSVGIGRDDDPLAELARQAADRIIEANAAEVNGP